MMMMMMMMMKGVQVSYGYQFFENIVLVKFHFLLCALRLPKLHLVPCTHAYDTAILND